MAIPFDESRRHRPTSGRVPPHNLEAEQSLLGAMLLSHDAIATAVQSCKSEDFYKPAHGHVYEAIIALYGRGEPADAVTVADELRRDGMLEAIGGPVTLLSLQTSTPATSNAGRYAAIVEEHALLRRLIGVAGEIAELGYSLPDDVVAAIDTAENLVFNVAQHRVADTTHHIGQLVGEALENLERLYDRGESITGVPTGFTDLDECLSGLQPSNLVIVGARPAMGKCVAWDTPILDPATGSVATAADLHRAGSAGAPVEVVSVGGDGRLRLSRPSAFIDDGHKPVFRVTTSGGRQVRTTLTHPFLTPEGWRPLAALAPGNPIGVPSRLPVFGQDAMCEAEVVLLAYMVGQADLRSPSPVVSTAHGAVIDDLRGQARRLGIEAQLDRHRSSAGHAPVWVLVPWRGELDPLAELLRRHDLAGRAPHEVVVPDAVRRLPRAQLALFLNRLLATDRVGFDEWGHGRLTFEAASLRLAHDVQHLLLRFGVSATVNAHRGGATLVVAGDDDLCRLARSVGVHADGGALDRFALRVGAGLVGASLPAGRESVARAGGVAVLDVRPAPHHLLGPALPDVAWETIIAIEADGIDQVYDLTVPGDHNFVAADIFVHNTSFALNIVSNAALRANVPTLFFSLEMGHLEVTSRLLCAEARVDANRMRNGKLHEPDWAKISHAIGRLGEAPIYIDDNPNITVMDIRAKSRRMKSRGGLGLVVVDYLQLMSGRGNAENRQVEVSEISRGLKILARELEVPVIALSQLSRNLEMRADKRPMLADLRESGSLEQDADVVMFLYRDSTYNPESPDRGTAEVIVAKHRSGPIGFSRLAFLEQYTRFENMARGGVD